jgi:hypothetical protein
MTRALPDSREKTRLSLESRFLTPKISQNHQQAQFGPIPAAEFLQTLASGKEWQGN